MLRLRGAVQQYDWGRIGEDSEVASLYCMGLGERLEEDKPYAELWIGTHESGPAFVVQPGDDTTETSLKEWITQHPESLGDDVRKRWSGELPFLFKVLSIRKALSIQAHPDKMLAELLHRNKPYHYKDSNHKPEMAIALNKFEALCGFVSIEELKDVLRILPELRSLLHKQEVELLLNLQQMTSTEEEMVLALRGAFTTLMTLSKDRVSEKLRELVRRLSREKQVRQLTAKEELVLLLEEQYPDDVGVFAALFLNYIKLSAGEALYLNENVPHAYLSGDCVECMATSDNVVRAGLTSKFRDTETLCSMLTYDQAKLEILTGFPVDSFTKKYTPPFDEFEVDHIFLQAGDSTESLSHPGPSLFLVYDGRGIVIEDTGDRISFAAVRRGDLFFFPAGKMLKISNTIEADDKERQFQCPLRIYRAGVNSRFFGYELK